ncbi:hypothetical protein ACHAXT_005084 [Thalassiosira profunda]
MPRRAAAERRDISLAAWHKRKRRWNGRPQQHPKALLPRIQNPNGGHEGLGGGGNSDGLPNATGASSGEGGFSPGRFFNPWRELATVVPSEDVLSDKVESTTRTFGIVAALMGSLAACLLTFNRYDGYDAVRDGPEQRKETESNADGSGENDESNDSSSNDNSQLPLAPSLSRRPTRNFVEHVTYTHHVAGTSLLVSWGVDEARLDDLYTAACAGSFYTGVLTTVLSSVINAWLAATPPGGVRSFVRLHSWYIVSLPALLGISTSLAGAALFIALDREHGTPVSYVGLGGSVVGGAAVATVLGCGWLHNYRALTAAVARRQAWGTGGR